MAHCWELCLNFAQVTFGNRTVPGLPKSGAHGATGLVNLDTKKDHPWKMATSVVNSDTLDVQPSTSVNYQDLESLDEGDERFPSPQSSCRRVCPTNRLVLALMAACGILTLSVVVLGFQGTKSGCCPKDWQMFQESCYWMSRATLSWENAKRNCERKNAHLRFINQRKRPVMIWIGLTDVSGNWNDWMENQPDHWYGHGLGGGEDCVHMNAGGAWNDNHCSRAFYWICEMELKI
ncbi:hypothetical protein JD844_000785 [Phrynosoma platyrhinos]|uniref:C-type lectin domain-containing protein n=1 Tax=Phrynosoma platyrhinos TaxID=52577 RepID=A0ABQ7T9F1_PHRPL|nr:hypothetical protein JD844_000785 [Phrynosoma platyrhinos]